MGNKRSISQSLNGSPRPDQVIDFSDNPDFETPVSSLIGHMASNDLERLALEPRILLDAAGVETGTEIADTVAAQQAENWQEKTNTSHSDILKIAVADREAATADFPSGKKQIAFIDAAVDDAADIIAGIDASVEVILLDAKNDGVEQMASVLAERNDIEAIHIISHCRSGTLDLGTTKLTEASMRGKHADEMEIIRNALSENADILIYGCDFGANARGASAVEALAQVTGADIAASNDLTGAAALGGYWDLEVEQGSVEAASISSAEFTGVLIDAPTLDLEKVDSAPTPGQNGYSAFAFTAPTIQNDG